MIDAVILWTDGAEASMAAKLKDYVPRKLARCEDVAAPTRFSSMGEIKRCVASIRKFAPFIDRIFIVTDAQDPGIEGVKIVDHREIYRGYEHLLPIFSSRSIETMIWRIPGLSERFIYFNDDFILRRPCLESDFFDRSSLVCRAQRFNLPLTRLLSLFEANAGYKTTLASSASLLGYRWSYLYTGHLPHPQFRSLLEGYYLENEGIMLDNAGKRFRSPAQFNPAALGYLLAERSGRLILKSRHDSELYYKYRNSRNYTQRKLSYFDTREDALALCFNSLDLAPEQDIKMVLEWIDNLLK